MKKSMWLKFSLYLIVAVLVNLVSLTLFFRIDLTSNKVFSLSKASKTAVNNLEEPLTIKAFFSENLPQPYNNLPQEFLDIMEEYSLAGGKNFNFQVYTINKDGTTTDKKGRNLKELAESYSIFPVQIQNIQSDEVKLQNAYMGLVMKYGNMSETIGSLASVKNIEYLLTTRIYKITNKISALLALKDPVKVQLYLSSTLNSMSKDLAGYPQMMKSLTEELNAENYDKLVFEYIDPDKENLSKEAVKTLSPFNLKDSSGKIYKVYAAAGIENGGKIHVVNILKNDIFGYSLMKKEDIKSALNGMIESSLGINKVVGYMINGGTPPLYRNPYVQQQQNQVSLDNLHRVLSDTYTIRGADIDKDGIPKGIKTLLVVGPKEKLSDWALYQIDQFIMGGNSVAFLVDTYNAVAPQNQNPYYPQPPTYVPVDSGLDNLLKHYGVTVEKSFVMDENCYVDKSQTASGGYQEVPVYFAPKILPENIDNSIPFIKNIKGLITLNSSPIKINDGADNVTVLFSSSQKSWEMKDTINLYNPMMVTPPAKDKEQSYPLAVLIEGKVKSYFDGKPIPTKPRAEAKEGEKDTSIIKTDKMEEKQVFIPETENGKIFVIGTSMLFTDNLLDKEGSSPNAVFVTNLIDHLNGRDDFAIMRAKGQIYNPLVQTTPRVRSFIKGFNIAGLPALVIITGLVVWALWIRRRKRIESIFKGNGGLK